MTQLVYLFRNIEVGIIKIGISSDIKTRKRAIELQSGFELEIIGYSYALTNAQEIEFRMHEFFKDRRKLGEWFNITSEEALIKLNEIQYQFGKINPIFDRYRNGETISSIAKSENCTRQNIIYQLKKFEIHNIPNPLKIESIKVDCTSTDVIEFKDIQDVGRIDAETLQNKKLLENNFRLIEKNIFYNELCYQLKKWINGSFDIKYYYTIDDARKAREITINK